MADFPTWLYDSRHPMILAFVLFAVFSGVISGFSILIPFFTAMIVAGFADLLFIRYRLGGWAVPSSGLVTGSIVGLVTAYTTPLWLIAVISLLAIASKLIAWKGKHFFNPANFGMLLGIYFFGLSTAWWGANSVLLVALLGLFVVYRSRKWWVVVPFLLAYLVIRAVLLRDVLGAFLEMTAPALLFFTMIMLIEPRTSPTRRIPQAVYGVLAAILVVTLATVPGDLHLALVLAKLSVPVLRMWFK